LLSHELRLNQTFKKNSTYLQDRAKVNSLFSLAVSWFKKLQQLISGANSKTGMRLEQSEWTRASTKSVEVTVETDEIIVYQPAHTSHSNLASMALNQKANEGRD
jgi:hypothetical protein